jgi:hypothetical protein
MQTPTTLSLLYDVIPWLKAMNQRTPRPPGAHASEDKRAHVQGVQSACLNHLH